MRNYKNRVIILNVIITKFFAIINENENSKFQKMKNLINRFFIEIDENINTRFEIFIIFIHIIYFLIDIHFKYINLNFLIIIILFKYFIFKKHDIVTQTNLIHKIQIISFKFCNVKMTRNIILKTI